MSKKKSANPGGPRPLTPEEIAWMREYTDLPFLRLPVHVAIEHQMRLSLQGLEHALVLGPPGVGKSVTIRVLSEQMEMDELQAGLIPGSTHQARGILRYEASRAVGTKTVLLDLWAQVHGTQPSAGMSRASRPKALIEEIAQQLQIDHTTLICVDEAQMISPDNLDLLRQVPDAARDRGHPVGLLLSGTPTLRDSLIRIGQLGQRFSAEIALTGISLSDWNAQWAGFHPHLEELRAGIAAAEWRRLTEAVFRATSGNFRRLRAVLVNANQLALHFGYPIDTDIVEMSIDKLGPEA